MINFLNTNPRRQPSSVRGSSFEIYVPTLASILHPKARKSHVVGRLPYHRESGTSFVVEYTIPLYFCVVPSVL